MGDQEVTVYPGDSITIHVGTGQAPETDETDPSAGDAAAIGAESEAGGEPSTPTEPLPPGAAPDEPVVDVGPAAGTVPSPVDLP